MIFSEILFELKRIANSLEVLANTKLESKPKGTPPPIEFFDSTKESDEQLEIELSRDEQRIQTKMLEASKAGFFFEEDAIPEELIERI